MHIQMQFIEVPVQQIEEEIVHVPKVITQQRVQREQVEQIVGVPVPMIVLGFHSVGGRNPAAVDR